MDLPLEDIMVSVKFAEIAAAFSRWAERQEPPVPPYRCPHHACRQSVLMRYAPNGAGSHFEHYAPNRTCPLNGQQLEKANLSADFEEWIPRRMWSEMAAWWGRRTGGGDGGAGVGVRMPIAPLSPLRAAAAEFDDDDGDVA